MPLHIKKLLLSDYSSWQRLFFQVHPVPGATIVGALMIGVSRATAAEFTFFLAVPVMFGASLLKAAKYILAGIAMTGGEALILLVGTVVAFIVSVFVIKFLMGYIKKHDFKVFGWYRIILGILVILILR